MCLLFETIRLEGGRVHFAEYHQRRVDRSIGVGRVDLTGYIRGLDLPCCGCFKLRITYSAQGILEHTIAPYVVKKIETLRLVADDTINYLLKWNDRSAINRLYELRDDCDDILIIRRGVLTDASFANIALYDGNRWVTPSHPLHMGTCRERLVEQEVVVSEHITVQSLARYSKLVLINAMVGFDPSRAIAISGLTIKSAPSGRITNEQGE